MNCTVEGCSAKSIARGFCHRHYARWQKHGDPTGGRTREGAVLEWITSHVGDGDGDCIIFPFARKPDGYGAMLFEGRVMGAHRAMCTLAHGAPPSPEFMAAHSCGRGNLGCVHPKHLRWATAEENAADLALHREQGIAPPTASRLSETDCEAIRASKGRETMKVTGLRYGISESMVCRIQLGNRRAVLRKRVA
jgi:hypothetical protein